MEPFKIISTMKILNRSMSNTNRGRHVLKMLTKNQCQLCDEALMNIEQKLPANLRSKINIEKVDIYADGNENLYDRWRFEIPVFYFNDKYLCKNHIDLEKLVFR